MNDLSIIILQHNTPQFVQDNLNALQKANLPKKTEIIVVNNGGNQANQKIDKTSYSKLNIQFFDTPNNGFPAGNNFGLSKTKAKYYAFMNPDIVVEKDTISYLLNYLKEHPQVGIVAPQLYYKDGSIQDNYRTFPRIIDLIIKRIPFLRSMFTNRMRSYLLWDRNPDSNEPVDWVTGAFIIVTDKCLQKIKKHDDRYFLFMSDVVICREAYQHGFETHIVGATKCLHNDTRLSGGGITDIFRKKVLRIHLKDAFKYFWHYKFTPLPKNAPSKRKK